MVKMSNDEYTLVPTKKQEKIIKSEVFEAPEECEVYRKRWGILTMFCLASMFNASHWIQYSMIAHIMMKYYDVSAMLINWTSMIFMAVYIPFVFPATWVLEKKGLRFAMIIGILMMITGAWLKLFTLGRDKFYLAFVAQFIIGSSQIFILSVPARLAGLWFGENEVSTACSIGVFGNQVGIAISFLLPPAIVTDSDDMDVIREDLTFLHYYMAFPPTILLLFVLGYFEASPPKPPSVAQANIRGSVTSDLNYLSAMKKLFLNKDYVLLSLSYGANVGVFYAYSTLLNQIFWLHFPGMQDEAGRVGLTLIIGGMLGAVTWGIILDKTHKYKFTTVLVYTVAFVGMIGFTLSLYYDSLLAVYMTSAVLGFFMNGYLPVAYEYAAELTYPLAESTSSGVLNAVGELVGVTLVFTAGFLLDQYGDLPTNIGLSTFLALGLIICLPISGSKLLRLSVSEPQQSSN